MMILFMNLITAVFICISLVVVGIWCWIRWTHRHLIKAASNLDSLFPTVPFLGSLHYTIFGVEKMTAYAINSYIQLSSRGINTCCIWLGPYPIICICGVDDIQTVNSTMKAPIRGFEMDTMRFVLGNGLLTAPANIWKTTRRAIEPLFHSRNLKQLFPTFNKNCRELVTRLSQYEGQGTFDVSTVVIDTSLQSICHLVFGPELEFNIDSDEFRDLVSLVQTAPDIELQKIFKFWLQSDLIFTYLYKKEIEKMDQQWENFSKTPLKIAKSNNANEYLVKEYLAENDSTIMSDSASEGSLNLISIYSVLQETFPTFSEKDLKSEIMTMYIAGSDSANNAVSHCLLLLAYHQDVQERLYKEICSVLDTDRDITSDDLQRMPYLDQVIKETFRWSMVIPFSSRRTFEEIKLSCVTIPKNDCFLIVNVGPFLDHKIYPNPTKFNPEHFSPENSKARDKAAYLPFNAGPRNCIGKLYTELLARLIVAHVIKQFKLSTKMDVYKLKRKMGVFIHSYEGYNISIQRR